MVEEIRREPVADRRRGGNTLLFVLLALAALLVAAFAFGLIDVDQNKEARLPEVSVEGGQAPSYDVDTADVNVGTKTESVPVPDVDVDVSTDRATVEVPSVDVDPATDNNK